MRAGSVIKRGRKLEWDRLGRPAASIVVVQLGGLTIVMPWMDPIGVVFLGGLLGWDAKLFGFFRPVFSVNFGHLVKYCGARCGHGFSSRSSGAWLSGVWDFDLRPVKSGA